MILTYVCPTIAKGTADDPVRKILVDLGVSFFWKAVHYGEKEALVQIEVSYPDAEIIKKHKDVKIVKNVSKVGVDYSEDLGKNGIEDSLNSKRADGTSVWDKTVIL
jgi:hypothetical protein